MGWFNPQLSALHISEYNSAAWSNQASSPSYGQYEYVVNRSHKEHLMQWRNSRHNSAPTSTRTHTPEIAATKDLEGAWCDTSPI
ncbi:hypothetical protein JAAARDRAFT_213052 [Jaapia argillacea MUCL 33604]|uniref:Uncharacterized protein n=1 Tax=Jaapia argillacea MUCL 33604 TaxID=933084 RepID=A0A067QMV4_9AGAM|nr:hypothetical protein JAAARDRAFT_213052 [Jaapia argillacea MUCL 33604]